MFALFLFTFLLNLATTSNVNMSTDNSSDSASVSAMGSDVKYLSVDFEVFGRVQGVFFRKYTQKQAEKLGLSGWCLNTDNGTVQGNMQGAAGKISDMKSWLKSVGSPQSRIDKAVFSQEIQLKQKPNEGFTIRR